MSGALYSARIVMTRREMEQLISLREEIKSIEKSMASPKSSYVAVFYKDYRTGKGIPKSRQERDGGEEQLRILRAQLNACKKKLLKRLQEAEAFIEAVEDSKMRTILRSYYINGDNQMDIGKALGYTQTAISKKLKAFWFEQGDTYKDSYNS